MTFVRLVIPLRQLAEHAGLRKPVPALRDHAVATIFAQIADPGSGRLGIRTGVRRVLPLASTTTRLVMASAMPAKIRIRSAAECEKTAEACHQEYDDERRSTQEHVGAGREAFGARQVTRQDREADGQERQKPSAQEA